MKTKWQLGDRAFEVEWCVHVPVTESGDVDTDNIKYARKFVSTIEEALRVAREKYPGELGVVTVTEVEWIDPHGDRIPQTYHWECVADSLYLDNDSGELHD